MHYIKKEVIAKYTHILPLPAHAKNQSTGGETGIRITFDTLTLLNEGSH
jgi:hypothetical protein